MDKLIYVSMNGAKNAMRELEIITNNLANVNTTGFRGDSTFVMPEYANKSDHSSRVYAKMGKTYTDFKTGPVLNTGRDLDAAIDGDGFFAIQSKTGKEGYSRAGDFQLGQDGLLVTQAGQMVIGNSGAINIPSGAKISIESDGTVYAKFHGASELVPIDKLKLVNPDTSKVFKGHDGLFYVAGQESGVDADNTVKLIPHQLEGSNVNAIELMTQIIDLSRSYEMHTNFMKTISENASKSNQLLNMNV